MPLRSMVQADIDNVFLNANDFAEEIVFDGTKMLAVIEELVPNVGYNTKLVKVGGTFVRSLYLYFREPTGLPVIGKRIMLERGGATERWTIKERIYDGGLLRLKLEAVDS